MTTWGHHVGSGLGPVGRAPTRPLLAHPRRAAIWGLLTQRPGASLTEILHRLGTCVGVTEFHLHRLERAGLVLSRRSGRCRRYYLVGQVGVPYIDRHAAIHSGVVSTRLMEVVRAEPGLSQLGLQARMGFPVSRQAIAYHIRRLVRAGALQVDRTRSGHAVRLATPAGNLRAADLEPGGRRGGQRVDAITLEGR